MTEPEHLDLEEALRRARVVAQEVLARIAPTVDSEAKWPEAGIVALQRAGLGGLVVPRELGGSGLGLLGVARVCEVLGGVCPSTAISFGMHLVGSAVISVKATDDQRRRYLEPIVRGEHLTTLALSEPGTGAHFYIPECRLEARPNGGFRISGTKSFVTNGGHADSYVLSVAEASPDSLIGKFSCVIVRSGAPGARFEGAWDGWGMRGNDSRTLSLDGVEVPAADLLGREGDEIWYVFHVIAPYFLMAMAGTYLGLAAAALEEGREHILGRSYSHTGGSVAESTVMQHRLGTLWAKIQRTRALIYEAARSGDAGHAEAFAALCSAKAEVAETADRVIAEVMTLMGGRAYASGATIHRRYRDARAAHVMAPTTDMLRTWVGRVLLDRPILGE